MLTCIWESSRSSAEAAAPSGEPPTRFLYFISVTPFSVASAGAADIPVSEPGAGWGVYRREFFSSLLVLPLGMPYLSRG